MLVALHLDGESEIEPSTTLLKPLTLLPNPMFRSAVMTFLALIGLLTMTSAAESEWQVTTQDPGSFPLLAPIELKYNLSWNGVLRAGEATLVLAAKDPENEDRLLCYGKARSAGLAKKFWYYKTSFTSLINPTSLRPVSFEAKQYDREEMSITKVAFSRKLVTSQEMLQERGGTEQTEGKGSEFGFGNTYDLMSTVLYLRSLPLENEDEMTMVVHPLTTPYLAQFRVLGREKFNSGIGETDAIRLEIRLQKIKDDFTLKGHDKFKEATIWVSDDEYRVPLEIRSEIFVGSVRATLESRGPVE